MLRDLTRNNKLLVGGQNDVLFTATKKLDATAVTNLSATASVYDYDADEDEDDPIANADGLTATYVSAQACYQVVIPSTAALVAGTDATPSRYKVVITDATYGVIERLFVTAVE